MQKPRPPCPRVTDPSRCAHYTMYLLWVDFRVVISYACPMINVQEPETGNPETRLILLCAAPFEDSIDQTAVFSLLDGRLDWPKVAQISREHKTGPLLYLNLRGKDAGRPPPAVTAQFEQAYVASAGRLAVLTRNLLELVGNFEKAGIRTLSWKGPSMAALLYPDPGARPCDDLDFLVHPDDISKAVNLLAKNGYEPHVPVPARILNSYLGAGLDYVATNSQGDLWIDLSTLPTPSYFALTIDADSLWASARTITIENTSIPLPCPEHLLYLLCVHASKHGWERLLWVCDVAALLWKYPELDFGQIAQVARRQGGLRLLLLGLQLARSIMNAKLQGRMEEEIKRDPEVTRLADSIIARWLESPKACVTGRELFRFHMRMRERLRDRARHAARLVFTPSYGDWMSLPLPEPLFFLYWFTRPVRLAANALKRLVF